MNWMLYSSLTIIVLTLGFRESVGVTCPGCLDLDEISFDKTIKRFPYALVKFDVAFPFGEKHEAFAAFSESSHKITDDLLIATVGIKDYGVLENKKLGERFNIDEKSFPEIVLFRDGDIKDHIFFPKHLDVTMDNLKQFVSQNTELYLGKDGCLKEFNNLVRKYANQEDSVQLDLIQKAEELHGTLTKDSEKTNGQVYLKFMRKIHEKGYDFVEEETKRLLRLKAGKVSDAKKQELKEKLNILDAFRVTKLTKVKNPKEDL